MNDVADSKRWEIGFLLLTFLMVLSTTGCFRVSKDNWYSGPPTRPQELVDYYDTKSSYLGYREEVVEQHDTYTWKHLSVDSESGPIVIDLFDTKEKDGNLILVFPVLGGKLFIETHVAKFFAERGISSAIVNRSNEFKDSKNFDQLESIFRSNVIRDRIALDFLEKEQGKFNFGTFGISRGGINVALTAGVDARLKYNVMVLGGTDLVDLFRDSNQPRIQKYIDSVMRDKGLTREEVFTTLKKQIRTDPKNTAQYIDANNTLLILGLFDRTVPFSYGQKLREQIGRPDTVYLLADHYLGFLFTQTISILPPSKGGGLFPFPYIEQEALSFFRRSFGKGRTWALYPYRALQLPFNIVAEIVGNIGSLVRAPFVYEEPEKALGVEELAGADGKL